MTVAGDGCWPGRFNGLVRSASMLAPPSSVGHLLEEATALCAEHGFSDTVTQVLAEKLQVGKGTLYRYFPSKRDLFLAAVDRVMRRLSAHVDAQIELIHDPMERVGQAIGAYLS